ncbi:MAG: ribonuclease III [Chloroflexota bacterium]|nr:ribonuclease III [Chloroflexota bacterium]MDE2895896.1 ribonuclease III [Chloroflexota bacterium]
MCASPNQQLDGLQDRLRYQFANVALLRQAMVHRSYLNEVNEPNLQSNERLEFLGDAVLGAVVAQRLFSQFPDAGEGWMTVARSQLVRNESLGRIGSEIGIGDCLLLGAGIDNDGARERPSVLSRALEAVIGAVWLDGGEQAAQGVILRLLRENVDALTVDDLQADAKSQLQHLTQARTGAKPSYSIIEQAGPPHDRSFQAVVEVDGVRLAQGEGRSKQAAEMAAAQHALSSLAKETA